MAIEMLINNTIQDYQLQTIINRLKIKKNIRFPDKPYTIQILLWDDNTYKIILKHGETQKDKDYIILHHWQHYKNKDSYYTTIEQKFQSNA